MRYSGLNVKWEKVDDEVIEDDYDGILGISAEMTGVFLAVICLFAC